MKADTIHITGTIPIDVRDEMRRMAEVDQRSFNYILNFLLAKALKDLKKEKEVKK